MIESKVFLSNTSKEYIEKFKEKLELSKLQEFKNAIINAFQFGDKHTNFTYTLNFKESLLANEQLVFDSILKHVILDGEIYKENLNLVNEINEKK